MQRLDVVPDVGSLGVAHDLRHNNIDCTRERVISLRNAILCDLYLLDMLIVHWCLWIKQEKKMKCEERRKRKQCQHLMLFK